MHLSTCGNPKESIFVFLLRSKDNILFVQYKYVTLNWAGPLLLPRQSLLDGDCDESLDCKY